MEYRKKGKIVIEFDITSDGYKSIVNQEGDLLSAVERIGLLAIVTNGFSRQDTDIRNEDECQKTQAGVRCSNTRIGHNLHIFNHEEHPNS